MRQKLREMTKNEKEKKEKCQSWLQKNLYEEKIV